MERKLLQRSRVVRLSVVLTASSRTAPRLEQAFRSLMIATSLRPGCLACHTWIDPDWSVNYQEDWASETQIQDRIRADTFTLLLSVVEASDGPPRVQFDFVDKSRGLDYVQEVRETTVG